MLGLPYGLRAAKRILWPSILALTNLDCQRAFPGHRDETSTQLTCSSLVQFVFHWQACRTTRSWYNLAARAVLGTRLCHSCPSLSGRSTRTLPSHACSSLSPRILCVRFRGVLASTTLASSHQRSVEEISIAHNMQDVIEREYSHPIGG
jgi:hypothetical protein